jgi:hypothetical protein
VSAALLLATVLTVTSTAADEGALGVRARAEVPAVAKNPHRGHVLDGSGYVLPRGRWQVGFVETKYGIFDWLNVGTSPYPWLLGPLLRGFSGNVSAKLGLTSGPVTVGLEGRLLYLDIERVDDTRSQLTEDRVRAFIAPVTGSVSFAPDATQTYSFATRLVLATGTGGRSVESSEIAEGAVASNAVHLLWSGRWRFTRRFGLYARGYFEPWIRNIEVDGTSQPEPNVNVRFTASIDTTEDTGRRWSVLGGAHLIFANVNLRLGLGYGSYFAPAIGVVVPLESFYPDLDLYVRF